MPSSCVHLKVAYLLKSKMNIKNQSEFYLGCISPDAVNLDGFAEQKVRYTAHIRDKDYDVWKEKIRNFYAENKSEYSDRIDFLNGFIVHLYTDIAWDEIIQPRLFEYLKSTGCSSDNLTHEKWEELFKFNSDIIKESWYKPVLDELSKAKCYDISSVSADLLSRYRDYLVDDYEDEKADEHARFLTEDMVNETADRVLEMYQALIK